MKFFITLCFAVALLIPGQILASEPTNYLPTELGDQSAAFAGEEGAAFSVTSDPRLIIASAVQILTSLLATVFLVYGIWGGYQIFVSRGDADQISKAKSTIITAAIGIFVMLLSYSITLFFTKSVQRAVGIDPRYQDDGGWNVRIEIDPNTDINLDPLSAPRDPGRIIR